MKPFFLSLLLIPLGAPGRADTRIQALRFDRTSVKAIKLAPGLGSMILFPCPLLEVFVGRQQDLKAQISPNDKKTLFLNLKLNASLPTNFIARCEGEKNFFVFDVIPSKAEHQDVLELRSAFGRASSPGFQNPKAEQVNSKKFVLQAPTLIEKGGSK